MHLACRRGRIPLVAQSIHVMIYLGHEESRISRENGMNDGEFSEHSLNLDQENSDAIWCIVELPFWSIPKSKSKSSDIGSQTHCLKL